MALYIGLALFLVRRCFGAAVGTGVDLPGTLWWHQWTLHAVRTGSSPTQTPWFFHPEGADLFANSGANLVDGLLALPWLAALGLPDYAAPFTVVLLLCNALAMRTLLREHSRLACVAGAALYEVHPFVLYELGGGRPTQALLCFLPLFLHFLFRGRGVLAGLMLAAQGWTYWFTGHFALLVLGPPLLYWAWRTQALKTLAIAAGSALVAVLPALVAMLLRADQVPWYEGDPEGVLTTWTLWAPMRGAYAPSAWGLLLTGAALLGCRQRTLWIPAAALALLVCGGAMTGLGWLLPGFDRLLWPYRAAAMLALVGAPALAEALDRLPSLRWRAGGVVLAGLLGGTRSALPSTAIEEPSYAAAIQADPGVVLTLPWLCSSSTVHLQPLHGSPLLGGLGEENPVFVPQGVAEAVAADPVLGVLASVSRGGPPTQGEGPSIEGVRWVVLHREAYSPAQLRGRSCYQGEVSGAEGRVNGFVQSRLGRPSLEDDQAVVWRLP